MNENGKTNYHFVIQEAESKITDGRYLVNDSQKFLNIPHYRISHGCFASLKYSMDVGR
jgi:hypothetical protein